MPRNTPKAPITREELKALLALIKNEPQIVRDAFVLFSNEVDNAIRRLDAARARFEALKAEMGETLGLGDGASAPVGDKLASENGSERASVDGNEHTSSDDNECTSVDNDESDMADKIEAVLAGDNESALAELHASIDGNGLSFLDNEIDKSGFTLDDFFALVDGGDPSLVDNRQPALVDHGGAASVHYSTSTVVHGNRWGLGNGST